MIDSKPNRPASFIVHRIALVIVLTAVFATTPMVPAIADSEVYSGAPISLELDDADLRNVLTVFSKVTDFVFAVDAQTAEMGGLDHLVSVVYESTPWDRALDEILTEAGLEWTLEGKVLWIHLPSYAPEGDRNFTGDAITLRLENAKLRDVLSNMSRVTGFDIDFDPNIETTISVNLRNVPWDQMLDLILRISGFDYSQEGDVLKVYQVSDTMGMQLISASNLTAEE